MKITRRDTLKVAAFAGAAMFIPYERLGRASTLARRLAPSAMPKPFTLPLRRLGQIAPTQTVNFRCPDGQTRTYPLINMQQRFTTAEIIPGLKTPVFTYNGGTPGQIVRARRGQPLLVRQANTLATPPADWPTAPVPAPYTNDPSRRSTSTHLHGSGSLPMFDGYASDLTYPGQVKQYFYPNSQEARTMWYHDHAVHHTAQNAYAGMAGFYLLHDRFEHALKLPSLDHGPTARYDVPLVIRDAMFDDRGNLIYNSLDENGVFGDIPLINGVPWPTMTVEPRLYRFRLLNASIARSWEWRLHDGTTTVPMTVIATDSGFMPRPQRVTQLKHGMAERYEILIDFSRYKGATITLQNLFPNNNINFSQLAKVMQFKVAKSTPTNRRRNVLKPDWADVVEVPESMTWTRSGLDAQNVKRREFLFDRLNGQWRINGETWQDVVDSGYTRCQAKPNLGDIEIWTLTNAHGGWFHPVHIHLVDFQILTRNGSAANVYPYERGPKDTVYVGENESVEVAMRFAAPPAGEGWPAPRGRFMVHCHNLIHEDHDMMMQFSVGDPDHLPEWNPITAAPATPI